MNFICNIYLVASKDGLVLFVLDVCACTRKSVDLLLIFLVHTYTYYCLVFLKCG